jgi:hypothetical protein
MTSCRNLHSLSDCEIVNLCMTIPHFAGSSHGNRLTRISEKFIVKFGIGVQRQEAANQMYARLHVDNSILYIPQVFHFFSDASFGFNMGFIVMEYVSGVGIDALDIRNDPTISKHTINAVRHLATIPLSPDQGPGPVGGGPAYGYLWSESGTGQILETVEDMERWFNKRLSIINQPPISLARQQQLRMCHMDLVRRNICILPDSRICFLDWAFAGFYPPIFEIHILRELRTTDEVWFNQLLCLLPKPDVEEEEILLRLGLPAIVNETYW